MTQNYSQAHVLLERSVIEYKIQSNLRTRGTQESSERQKGLVVTCERSWAASSCVIRSCDKGQPNIGHFILTEREGERAFNFTIESLTKDNTISRRQNIRWFKAWKKHDTKNNLPLYRLKPNNEQESERKKTHVEYLLKSPLSISSILTHWNWK